MCEAKRCMPVEVKGDVAAICSRTAAYLLGGQVDRTLLFGPVLWRPSDGTTSRRWYFMVAGSIRRAGCGTASFLPRARPTPRRCARTSWRRQASTVRPARFKRRTGDGESGEAN